jgi:hypothetical protein
MRQYRHCYYIDAAASSGITRLMNSLKGLSPDERREAMEILVAVLVYELGNEEADTLSRIALAYR